MHNPASSAKHCSTYFVELDMSEKSAIANAIFCPHPSAEPRFLAYSSDKEDLRSSSSAICGFDILVRALRRDVSRD